MQDFVKKYPLIFHLLGWIGIAFIFFIIFPLTYRINLPIEHYIYHAILLVFLMILYYLNVVFLLPKISCRKNGVLYILTLIILTIFLILVMNKVEEMLQLNQKLHQILHPNQPTNTKQNSFFISIYISISALIIFAIGISSHLIKNWNKEEKKKLLLKEEKTKAELSVLKAQINPHFFFNTLNTIHSLTYFEVEKSRIAIQKMAKMMRFVLNEEQNDKVLLKDEISFIENYIDLMRFRIPENVTLKVEISTSENEFEIAPMILLTFIENAFQYGISTTKDCEICLKINVENGLLILETINEIFENKCVNRSKNIGIQNTIKRLEIMYSSNYEYVVKIESNVYNCLLKIKLK
ncbi:histidine kinase [Empedobacter tilapiae]|uniref:sensor histidine kinase n=1 Tax=Empedobacter tilapiae TaxID=2491114 RepID=UPI0028D5FCA8|nr:histidine kinase [Empedobacter tilapiae]